MKKIKFEKEQRDAIVAKIRRHFIDELDQELGVIPAEMLQLGDPAKATY